MLGLATGSDEDSAEITGRLYRLTDKEFFRNETEEQHAKATGAVNRLVARLRDDPAALLGWQVCDSNHFNRCFFDFVLQVAVQGLGVCIVAEVQGGETFNPNASRAMATASAVKATYSIKSSPTGASRIVSLNIQPDIQPLLPTTSPAVTHTVGDIPILNYWPLRQVACGV
jgi:hypothetical protein